MAQAKSADDAVAGTVVDARDGHHISHAIVQLAAEARESRVDPVTTDDEGRFTFAAVAPGKYNLSAVAPGYFSASYLQHEGFYTGIVTGAGLQTTSLELQLTRLAVISGHILDEAGEPGINTQVALYRKDPGGDSLPYIRAGNASTDSEGRYSFRRLLPGKYFIAVTSTPGTPCIRVKTSRTNMSNTERGSTPQSTWSTQRCSILMPFGQTTRNRSICRPATKSSPTSHCSRSPRALSHSSCRPHRPVGNANFRRSS